MSRDLLIGLAQINPLVGDIAGNVSKVRELRARAADCDLIVFGELALAGYPPEDLVWKRLFQDRIEKAAELLANDTADGGAAILLGAPWRAYSGLFNAALLMERGEIVQVRLKHELPNYGVFDEKRVFNAGSLPEPMPFRGVRLGTMICEDMWQPTVARHLRDRGCELLVVINASPFEVGKVHVRRSVAAERVRETKLPLLYVNLVGGQDELVFDGGSFVYLPQSGIAARARSWTTGITPTKWEWQSGPGWRCQGAPKEPEAGGLEGTYQAMMVGLRDYTLKNRFPGVVIGLSGGIDSALTAAVAVDALGVDKVRCVMMPSPFTSRESLEDAQAVAGLLGVALDRVPIQQAMDAFSDMLSVILANRPPDETEENIQARCRGLILMAISNKLGSLVLTTGNKSEMSVGYATLYGDMCGGYSVLKDIYKTTVFELARWRNQFRPEAGFGPDGRVIPERVITKPPSAELKPGQTDQDSLPPYEILDGILSGLIEEDASIEDVVQRGFDRDTVRRVWRMLDRAEYKRRQAPPGVKISARAFGRDRRYPITNGFTDHV